MLINFNSRTMLEIKLIDKSLKLPSKAHVGDAGWDLYSTIDAIIPPGCRIKIPLGFIIIGKSGMVYKIESKSSLSWNYGIDTIGNIIDNNYRGECHAILINHNLTENVNIKKGEKIAQLLVQYVSDDDLLIVNDQPLEQTNRNDGGFGSTGNI